jgi:serine/threonine protein kinase
MTADQMLKRIEFLHRQGYVHRAVSLRKFAVGSGKNSKRIYLCGLGQGKQFRKDGVHMPYREGRTERRELKYLSMNRQLGIECSRRDDLESLMYCWAKMLYGQLPWEGEEDPEKVLSRKLQNSGAVIFASFPKSLQQAYDYSRGLAFDEDPNY